MPQLPIMNNVLHGFTRDQMMTHHEYKYWNICYTPSADNADIALAARTAMITEIGIKVYLCRNIKRIYNGQQHI